MGRWRQYSLRFAEPRSRLVNSVRSGWEKAIAGGLLATAPMLQCVDIAPRQEESHPMQKLEEILHAEDSARHRVAEARDEAERIVRESAAEADLVRASAKRQAAEQAQAEREVVLSGARADAERIRTDAEAQLKTILSTAEDCVQAAVRAVAQELMG